MSSSIPRRALNFINSPQTDKLPVNAAVGRLEEILRQEHATTRQHRIARGLLRSKLKGDTPALRSIPSIVVREGGLYHLDSESDSESDTEDRDSETEDDERKLFIDPKEEKPWQIRTGLNYHSDNEDNEDTDDWCKDQTLARNAYVLELYHQILDKRNNNSKKVEAIDGFLQQVRENILKLGDISINHKEKFNLLTETESLLFKALEALD